MPIYEYRCENCHHRITTLVHGFSRSPVITCPNCSSTELNRLFSSFSIGRSDESVYNDILSDSQLVRGLEHDDPRALAEWNKRMSQGRDEETNPQYEEMLGRMETGEMPAPLKEPY